MKRGCPPRPFADQLLETVNFTGIALSTHITPTSLLDRRANVSSLVASPKLPSLARKAAAIQQLKKWNQPVSAASYLALKHPTGSTDMSYSESNESYPFSSVLTRLGTLSANPVAFLIVVVYAALWFIFKSETLDWHAFATLATWMMTLFIQRSEHRDTQAIHAKLDELLRSDERARTGLAKIDKKEPEDIEEHRDRANE